jgi:hypothetical protein
VANVCVPISYSLMREPVILPSSKTTVDLSTIKSHLLSDPTDPFNRVPLKLEEVVPGSWLVSLRRCSFPHYLS